MWLEPFQSDALEVGLCEYDFGVVSPKGFGTILEIQLTLYQEGVEFVRVGAIEGIWFTHFRMCGGHVMVRLAGFSQVMDGPGTSTRTGLMSLSGIGGDGSCLSSELGRGMLQGLGGDGGRLSSLGSSLESGGPPGGPHDRPAVG